MTHDGHIYNDDERSQIAGSDTIIYDGYNLNKDILSKYDKTFTLQPQTLVNWNDKKVNDEKNLMMLMPMHQVHLFKFLNLKQVLELIQVICVNA